ncbi:MAG: hypothetical protein ABH807_03040 [Candidatus Shapirobacteria bacterium]
MKNIVHLLIKKFDKKRAEMVVGRIGPYLKKRSKIIDIGSGSGYISSILKSQGFNITPVDVALLLMVLHHTPDPEIVFLEAARVSKNIRFITIVADTLGNLRTKAF